MLEFRVDTFVKNTHHPSGLSLGLTLNIRLRKGKYISYRRIWVNTFRDILFLFFFPTERGIKDKKGKWKVAPSFIILTSTNLIFNSSNTKIKDG